jgi:hypothetical protein
VTLRRAGMLLAFWALALAGPAGLAAARPVPAPAAAPASAAASTEQVLVLVRLPPAHFHPGAGYGGAYGDQGGRVAERRLADKIARAHGLSLLSDWPMPLLGLDCFVMAPPPERSAEAVAADLSRDPAVAWSQPMHQFHAEGATSARAPGHNDPLFLAQPAAHLWRLATLHETATGRHVSVAVIDSQVDVGHPDLAGQVMVAQDFTGHAPRAPELHGTGVAGIIAARADNGVGIAGVAPQARLMALRACWQTTGGTVCDTLTLAKALHFAIEARAQVINMSLAGPPDPLLGKLLDLALERGASVVAAYDPALPRGGFPASHAGVIEVADDAMAAPPPGVYSAPGRDVPTTQPGGRWSLVDGSSYAAAQVSGLVALVRERSASAAGAPLVLVGARSGGGPIDACATLALATPGRGGRSRPGLTQGVLSRVGPPCACACAFAGDPRPLVR